MEPEPVPQDVAATYCATLVDEWAAHGLTDVVVSPGSRSTPLALAFASDGRVRLHVHHDERSASFVALGLAAATRRPAAMLCTSGTAAVEFHAAIVEAHHACVPLIVITADRPPELRDVGAPQTIDQRELYGTAVNWYCEPGPPVAGGAPWWRDMAVDAWERATAKRPGPVHLNLAFREPLVGTPGDLPPARPKRPDPPAVRWGLTDEELVRLAGEMASSRGVVVAGVRSAAEPADAHAVHRLAAHLGWPVIADAPSGCRLGAEGEVRHADALLRIAEFAEDHRPDVVLRIGGLLTSKYLGRWLAASGAVQVGLDRHGLVPDPDGVVAVSVPGDVATVCDQLRGVIEVAEDPEWMRAWVRADRIAAEAIGRVLNGHPEATEPAAAIDLASLISDDGVLVVSSSMPVRDLENFAPPRPGLRVIANRGASGIDGVTSTAVGAALTGAPTALLIGDVAFLHDSNALLGLASRGVNLVLVVIDNDGGGIFSFLPQHELVGAERFEQLFGTPHGVDLVALAAVHAIPAERVSSRAGMRAAVAGALTRGGPRVVVVETDREANLGLHAEIADGVVRAWKDRR
jgi:2-succinyl-5-enolpyruvyl-6-hydroxy-3-cyclohexene-1-carboxylate synthase